MEIIRGRAVPRRPSFEGVDTFTGTVWIDPILPVTAEGHLVSSVTFAPGARTHWHSHAAGQFLIVTSGSGWVCSEGGPVGTVRAGDVVWTPPGQPHWHGATRGTVMTHTAISLGRPRWLHEVSESQYGPRGEQPSETS